MLATLGDRDSQAQDSPGGLTFSTNLTCRRSWLHVVDPLTGVDHSHRQQWFRDRMLFLSRYFCPDILAFSIITLAAYERLLWHLALVSRPELQARRIAGGKMGKRPDR